MQRNEGQFVRFYRLGDSRRSADSLQRSGFATRLLSEWLMQSPVPRQSFAIAATNLSPQGLEGERPFTHFTYSLVTMWIRESRWLFPIALPCRCRSLRWK